MQSICFIGFALIVAANAQHLFSDNTAAEDLVCGSWERILIDEYETIEEDITFNITDLNTYFGPTAGGSEDRTFIKAGSAFVGSKDYAGSNDIFLQTTSNLTRLEEDNTTECVFAAMVYSAEDSAFALTGDVCKNISTGEITALMHAVHQNSDLHNFENKLGARASGVTYYKFTINHTDCGEEQIGHWDSNYSLISRTKYNVNSTNENVKYMDFRVPTYPGQFYYPYYDNVNKHGLFYGLVTYSRPEINPADTEEVTEDHVIFGAYHGWDMYSAVNQTLHVVVASTFYTDLSSDSRHINTISFGGQLKIGSYENITEDLLCNLNFFRYDYCALVANNTPTSLDDVSCDLKNSFRRNQVIQERSAGQLGVEVNTLSKLIILFRDKFVAHDVKIDSMDGRDKQKQHTFLLFTCG
eukprot:m.33665 g.33665  ORF g.33665 m.33665 type:complete len:412 (+) comp8582_c0_seq2:309-1544(+)